MNDVIQGYLSQIAKGGNDPNSIEKPNPVLLFAPGTVVTGEKAMPKRKATGQKNAKKEPKPKKPKTTKAAKATKPKKPKANKTKSPVKKRTVKKTTGKTQRPKKLEITLKIG